MIVEITNMCNYLFILSASLCIQMEAVPHKKKTNLDL
jgi:hypothetical protein